MKYNRIKGTNYKVSRLSFGTARLYQIESKMRIRALLDLAADSGINSFDFAAAYGDGECERLASAFVKATSRRKDLILASKVFYPKSNSSGQKKFLSRVSIRKSLFRSLKNLKTDYLDILYCHRFDPSANLLEVSECFAELIQEGYIRHWGTSEWPIEALQFLHQLCKVQKLLPPVIEQREHSIITRPKIKLEELKQLSKMQMSLAAYSAAGAGIFAERYLDLSRAELAKTKRFSKENMLQSFSVKEKLRMQAKKKKLSAHQMALGWALKEAAASTYIITCSTPAQLEELIQVEKIF